MIHTNFYLNRSTVPMRRVLQYRPRSRKSRVRTRLHSRTAPSCWNRKALRLAVLCKVNHSAKSCTTPSRLTTPSWKCRTAISSTLSITITVTSQRARAPTTCGSRMRRMASAWTRILWSACWSRCRVSIARWRPPRWRENAIVITVITIIRAITIRSTLCRRLTMRTTRIPIVRPTTTNSRGPGVFTTWVGNMLVRLHLSSVLLAHYSYRFLFISALLGKHFSLLQDLLNTVHKLSLIILISLIISWYIYILLSCYIYICYVRYKMG